jgi:hypothetical protein
VLILQFGFAKNRGTDLRLRDQRGEGRCLVAQTFLSAGSWDIPVPCLKNWRLAAVAPGRRFGAPRRRKSRPNPQDGKPAPQQKNLQTPAKRRMKAFSESCQKQFDRLASSFSLTEKLVDWLSVIG